MKPGRYPGGMGGGFNMNQLMKQAQKMQQDMVKAQEELEAREYSASSGGGAVTATFRGSKTLESIKISKEVVDPEDVEMLEDMITAAVNEAMKKAQEETAAQMQKITGGALPGGMF